jgi:hypothetical protein
VSIVVAYLMKHHGMILDAALKLVCAQRRCAKPNTGFLERLGIFGNKAHGISLR